MPQSWETAIVAFLTNLFQTIGWGGVLVIMALESANIPIPSEVTMPLAGWLLVQAAGGDWWQAAIVGGVWGAFGCTLGSVASYWLGYRGGRPFVERYGKYFMVSRGDLAKADRWFGRYGMWATFLARLLPIVRTFISFPAGVMRIDFWRFTWLSFAGSLIWCAALAVGGWYFGQRWEALRTLMRPFDIPIAIALGAGFLYYMYRHVTHGLGGAEAGEPAE